VAEKDLAGLTGDSCPFCGERVKVGVLSLLPTTHKSIVRCGQCGERSQVAGRTRIIGGVAGLAGAALGLWISFPNLGSWCLAVAIAGEVVFGCLAARLTLRLDPPELAD
jgi:hypothetical protein